MSPYRDTPPAPEREHWTRRAERKADAYLRALLGFALLGLLLSVLVALSGCGASALERHTMAASMMHASASEAAVIIEADAQLAAERAIAPCREGRSEVTACDAALTEAMRPRRRAAAVQRTVAAAIDVYVAAVLAYALDGTEAALSGVVRALGRALALWDELAALLAEYGVPLPSLGPLVRGLLGSAS